MQVPLRLLYEEEEGGTVRVLRVLLVLQSVPVLQDVPPQVLGRGGAGRPSGVHVGDPGLLGGSALSLFPDSPLLVLDQSCDLVELIRPPQGSLGFLLLLLTFHRDGGGVALQSPPSFPPPAGAPLAVAAAGAAGPGPHLVQPRGCGAGGHRKLGPTGGGEISLVKFRSGRTGSFQ